MSTEYATVDDLFADELAETVDVPLANGKVVKVRGMSRAEMMLVNKGTDDPAIVEQRTLARCMVEPKVTEKQVKAWQETTTPMTLVPITNAIRNLSGFGEGAQKSDVAEAGD